MTTDVSTILDRLPVSLEWKHLGLIVLGWALLTAGSFAIVLRILLTLPPEYFEREGVPRASSRTGRIARNAAGVVLIAVGLVLSVPGVPGQGLLTVLTGILLVDFPGRRSVELAVVRRRGVLAALNRLRARFDRPPLRPPPPPNRDTAGS
jgi:hypothetical protein